MKYYLLSLFALISIGIVIGCNGSDESENTDPENMVAVQGMNESLARMASQNDSLVIHHNGVHYHHHDSIYHHHDSIYVHHHFDYHTDGDTIHHNPGNHHNEDHHQEHDSINAAHHNIAH